MLADISGHLPEPTGRDDLTVAVDDESALTAVVARLADEHIAVTELSLHLPSLDEVFLTLTGDHRAGTENSEKTENIQNTDPSDKEVAA